MRWYRSPAAIATGAVTIVVLGPLLVRGGIALRGDLVFAPDLPWKPAWLGLDGAVPRAVPMDALISVFDDVIPGALLQRVLLVAAFVLGGLGIARLASRFSGLAQVAAVVVYLWNPWVLERLAIGQWPMVLGYGLLPWLVLAAGEVRDQRQGGRPATMVLLIGAGICAPSMGLLGALVALLVVMPGRRRIAEVAAMALIANLPWIVPGLLGPSLHGSSAQFGDFAARGESSLGTFVSLLSMGGIWKSSIVPAERTHALVVGVAALLALAFAAGFRYVVPTLGRRTALAIAAAGGASFLLALLPAIGPAGDALGSLAAHWPAIGILRDSQRYLAPLGLLLALGAAALVERLGSQRALAALLVAAPVLLLPSLAWGLAGGLQPVHYPGDWARVSALRATHDGAVVSLPWTGSYRGYGWNDHRAVLDPAPRFLSGDVLVDDRVFLHDRVLPGEDPFLARVGSALDAPDPAAALRGLGVRWVLVEKGNGVSAADVPVGTVAFDGRWLRLVDLGAPQRPVSDVRDAPSGWIVVLCDLVTVFAGCVSILHLTRRLFRNRG
jgi:hypothetical protein